MAQQRAMLLLALLLVAPQGVQAGCPFSHMYAAATSTSTDPAALPHHHHLQHSMGTSHTGLRPVDPAYDEAVRKIDFRAVMDDLKKLFRQSHSFWPADYGHYGPMFIRLAWHCSGSYRSSDGRGGCEGGRQRFDPERSWEDNTNLDKARHLLLPLKLKYGKGLSWGDLFILAGTAAIEDMGGPVFGFCGGRVDDPDGYFSLELGPSDEQEAYAPCPVNGTCKPPLGSTTVGLIYLNPEGPMGNPNPEGSAPEVRDTFARMSMNDSETVALIGGGHAFGKTHGACPKGQGPPPVQQPDNPWPGNCGTGKGADAFTSGFEGPWTSNPTSWDNEYFKILNEHADLEVHKGPGGKHQWRVPLSAKDRPQAPAAFGNGTQDIMMLTTDFSLTKDPKFREIVKEFADDEKAFTHAFSHAWYKLITRDMGPYSRCVGNLVPEPQPFQHPLPPPPPPSKLVDFSKVREAIVAAMSKPQSSILPPDTYDGKSSYLPLFVRLAFQCASTFRATDFQGGCNGARLRFAPEKNWAGNEDLDKALALLDDVKQQFDGQGDLSWADLIAFAGTVSLEQAGVPGMSFCPGRTDASDGSGSQALSPWLTAGTAPSGFDVVEHVHQAIRIFGLSLRQFVALLGGGHSLGRMHPDRSGFNGTWTSNPLKVDNSYFVNILSGQWDRMTVPGTGKTQYRSRQHPNIFALDVDMALRWDPELAHIASEFAQDNDAFLAELSAAWPAVLNADRFNGPTGNPCDNQSFYLQNTNLPSGHSPTVDDPAMQ